MAAFAATALISCLQLAWSETLPKQIEREGTAMVLVAAGSFTMGSLDGEPDERPPRRVTLPDFYIDKHEVTCGQYARFLAATARKPPIDWPNAAAPRGRESHPVVNVAWNDAIAYAKWAGKRLPTEAEWEKAARGTDSRLYPWGNDGSGKKTASGADGKERLHPVGSFADDVSPCGAYDMAGNVWEWTADWYGAYPGNEAIEIEYGEKYRVIRGGGAIDYYGASATRRCSDRARSVPYATYDGLGFRCVLDASALREKP